MINYGFVLNNNKILVLVHISNFDNVNSFLYDK